MVWSAMSENTVGTKVFSAESILKTVSLYHIGKVNRNAFLMARKTSEFLGSVKKSISTLMIKSWHFFRNMAGLLMMMK